MKRPNLLLAGLTLAVIASYGAVSSASRGGARDQASVARGSEKNTDGEIHILPVQGDVYMLIGAGGNITVQVGPDGVLLVDSGRTGMSDKVVAAVRSVSDKPIRFIINTSVDADHTGGNEAIAKRYEIVREVPDPSYLTGIVAFQAVLARMSAAKGANAMPEGAWPSDTYSIASRNIFFNDDAIRIYHQPSAHTDGDSIVTFRHSDVVSTGDIFTTTNYPVIDLTRGGSIQGVINGLNRLIYDLTASGDKEAPLTRVIPGHGRLCDRADLVFYQEMVVIIRDRIDYMMKKGMTLEQIKDARPTRDYDPLYDPDSTWTPNMFIEAVYKSLAAAGEKPE